MTNDTSAPEPRKTQHLNARVTEAQALALKQYCVKHGISTRTAVLAALCAMIEGFESA